MTVFRKVDKNGFFLEDVVRNKSYVPTKLYISVAVPKGMRVAKWDFINKKWKDDKPFSIDEKEAFKQISLDSQVKSRREELLKKGAVSKDGKMWFNFESANMFMVAVGTLEVDESMPWFDKDKNKVLLTYAEAKVYAKEIRIVMQSLYGLN